jgi:hypothetical protein
VYSAAPTNLTSVAPDQPEAVARVGSTLDQLSLNGQSAVNGRGYAEEEYEIEEPLGHGVEHSCRSVESTFLTPRAETHITSYCGIHNPQSVVKVRVRIEMVANAMLTR